MDFIYLSLDVYKFIIPPSDYPGNVHCHEIPLSAFGQQQLYLTADWLWMYNFTKMHSYHYQGADDSLIFRHDDTPHHSGLPNFPHHKHVGSEPNVISVAPPDLPTVLQEIEALYPLAGDKG
jgi:hypothetical protein